MKRVADFVAEVFGLSWLMICLAVLAVEAAIFAIRESRKRRQLGDLYEGPEGDWS